MRRWRWWAGVGLLVVAAAALPTLGAASAASDGSLAWSQTSVTAHLPPCNTASCHWVLLVNQVNPDVPFTPAQTTVGQGVSSSLTVSFGPACGVIQADVTKNGKTAFGHQHTVPCPPTSTTAPPTTSTTTSPPPTTTSTTSSVCKSCQIPRPTPISPTTTTVPLTPQQQQIIQGVAPNGEVITSGNG
jgi:hypothetical protein